MGCSGQGAGWSHPRYQRNAISQVGGAGKGETGFTIFNTLAFTPLSGQILSKKAY